MVVSKIFIEIAYAMPEKQRIIELQVAPDCTIESAIQQSGLLALFPEIDLTKQQVGVFSQQRNLSDKVKEGDRIEIYRPLAVDPKQARRARAQQAQSPKKT
jgi:putative ubiquitin-RnfH superfamily antitoxin RatB of RatAB toxin-antitoxin module